MVRAVSQDRAPEYPAHRYYRGAIDRWRITHMPALLQERYAPGHGADRRGEEKQAADEPAEVGLRVRQDRLVGLKRGPDARV